MSTCGFRHQRILLGKSKKKIITPTKPFSIPILAILQSRQHRRIVNRGNSIASQCQGIKILPFDKFWPMSTK